MAAQDPTQQDLAALRAEVDRHEGILCVEMARLRDAHGAGKLGSTVVQSISKAVAGQGLGHFPQELPTSQDAFVYLFRLGSPVADLFHHLAHPSPAGAEHLRDAAGGADAAVLAKIRELVCD